MVSGKVSLKTFSGTKLTNRKVFCEEDVDGLFESKRPKSTKDQHLVTREPKLEEIQDLEIANSLSGDVFDGLVTTISADSSEESQSREDDVSAKVELKSPPVIAGNGEGDDDETNQVDYVGLRRENFTDDESKDMFSESQDVSTILSDSTYGIRKPVAWKPTPIECVDTAELRHLIAVTARQSATNIVELNRFLFEELEVEGFVGDVNDLRQEIVKTSLEKLENVQWSDLDKIRFPDLFSSLYGATIGVRPEEMLALEAAPVEDRLVPNAVQSSPVACMINMNDLVLEEGTEMPYLSCGDLLNAGDSSCPVALPENERQLSLPSTFECHNMTRSQSIASLGRPAVYRVRLNDGSMATVSVETLSRLDNCEWV